MIARPTITDNVKITLSFIFIPFLHEVVLLQAIEL